MSRAPADAFAVLTPPGRGGIAVLGCIGPGAARAMESCFRPSGGAAARGPHQAACGLTMTPRAAGLPEVGRLAYGHFLDAAGRPLDEIILYRAAPDRFEVNCHGGPAAVRAVSRRLAECGLDEVNPDRLMELEGTPPIERDARRALRAARTPLAARILLDQLSGRHHGEARRSLGEGGALAVEVERAAAALAAERTAEAADVLDRLLDAWRRTGRYLAAPPRIAVAGRPNAGKSTLVNRLAGSERVLVSPTPGTTRDFVDVDAALAGLGVVLVDTAGLRQAMGEIERLGVERAKGALADADLVIYLMDASEGPTADDARHLAALGDRALAVLSKADLVPAGPPMSPLRERRGMSEGLGPIAISALTGQGIEALVLAVLGRLGYKAPAPGAAMPFTPDQAAALEAAIKAVESGRPGEARRLLASLLTASASRG